MEFVYCRDCNELAYAPKNQKGTFEDRNASFNHYGHRIVRLDRDLKDYPPPVRIVLLKLNQGMEVTSNEIVLFKLALEIDPFFR